MALANAWYEFRLRHVIRGLFRGGGISFFLQLRYSVISSVE